MMEKINSSIISKNSRNEMLNDDIYIIIIKYIDLEDVLTKIILLNKQFRKLILENNYIIFKAFLKYFNLNKRLKRTDMLLKYNQTLLSFIKTQFRPIYQKQQLENLMPFTFETDGGTYNDDHYYFIQNIFNKTGVCYSTKLPKDVNVQAYIGKKILIDPKTINPSLHKPKQSEPNLIVLPYRNYNAEEQEETYKLLGKLEINNMGFGYTCFVKAFIIFVSDREINTQKSNIIKLFNGINSVEKFKKLQLPIKKEIVQNQQSLNQAFEIDLSSKKTLQKSLGTTKLECYPLLYVYSTPVLESWSYVFQQKVGCKYFIIKLIDSYKQSITDNNIDMYNLLLYGYSLSF